MSKSTVLADEIPEYIRITVRDKEKILDKITEQDFNVHLNLENLDPGLDHTVYFKWDIPKPLSSFFTVVSLHPEKITIRTLKKTEKTVTINPDISIPDDMADTASITDLSVTPPEMKISGPEKLLQTMTYLSTEKITVSSQDLFIDANFKILLPDESIQSDISEVRVTFKIDKKAQDKILQSSNFIMNNLKTSLYPVFERKPVFIKINGKLSSDINLDEIPLSVNCLAVTSAGTYTLKIEPQLPDGFNLIAINPEEIKIVFEKK
jgi:YbbR domain-containing protein